MNTRSAAHPTPCSWPLRAAAAALLAVLALALVPRPAVAHYGGEPAVAVPNATGVGDAAAYALTAAGDLVTFPIATPAQVSRVGAVTGLAAGESLVGMDFRPADGQLWAVASSGVLYTLDPSSGAATERFALAGADMAPVALDGTAFGVDFNPAADALRIVSDTGQNLRVAMGTQVTFVDGDLNGDADNAVAVAYRTNVFGAQSTELYAISADSDTLYEQDPPNDGVLTATGPLQAGGMPPAPVDADDLAGFDITQAGGAIAAVNRADGPALLTVNLDTGGVIVRGAIGDDAYGAETVTAVAAALPPPPDVVGLTADGELVSFSPAFPGDTTGVGPVTGLPDGERLLGIDFRPADGRLWSVSSAGMLYTVDPASGAATARFGLTDGDGNPVAISGTEFGVDVNPAADALRIVSDAGQNLRVSFGTQVTFVDGALNGAASGVTGVAYASNAFGAAATVLYGIDPASDQLVVHDPPNSGTLVARGPLALAGMPPTPADIDARLGFDISPSGAAFAALRLSGEPTFVLVNLTTGVVTPRGPIGDDVIDLAAPVGPSPVAYALSGGALVTFATATPGSVSTIGPVSGLASGETLVGMDFRPADGRLWAVGSFGMLYTIDTASGAATAQFALATADDTPVALDGTAFGVDFNPQADALRIVSGTGQNLRVGMGAQTTFLDGDLNGAAAGATVAAYENNVFAAGETELYPIDPDGDQLLEQDPPDAGTLVAVGPLALADGTAVDADALTGLDVAPTGTAFATIGDTLHSVNLDTGVVIPRGAVGVAGAVDALAVSLQELSAGPFGGAIVLPGTDAITAALAYSQAAFGGELSIGDGTDVALLGRADVFADSLASGAAQGALRAPLLLTGREALDPRVAAELERLGVETVYLLGGSAAVSAEVEAALTAAGYDTVRLDGATRLETAVDVAATVLPDATTAIVARAFTDGDADPTQAFADSLGGGAYAAATGYPVLLSDTAALSAPTADYLQASAVESVVLLGGTDALSQAVEDDLVALGLEVDRISGATRFDTAVAVAAAQGYASAAEAELVLLTEGQADQAWAPGFAAALLAAEAGGALVLNNGEALPEPTAAFLAGSDTTVVCGPLVSPVACSAAAG